MKTSIWIQLSLCIALALVAAVAEAATVTCTNPGDLQTAVNGAWQGEIISVSGTCTETFLTIGATKNYLILDGGGAAVIQDLTPPTAAAAAVSVIGAFGVQIRNFANITTNTTDGTGVFIADTAASVRLINNTISGNQVGVDVARNSNARIWQNTITGNSDSGILVRETSSARIGLNFAGSVPFSSPNTIQGNGIGVNVSRGSSARIMGNDISNNTGTGIDINRGSQADISSNTIASNGLDGISISGNSSVRLGTDTGTGVVETPNSGTNTGFGISCSINSSADGRLGTLAGSGGKPKNFDRTCVDSLLP